MVFNTALFTTIHNLTGVSKILDWIGIFFASGFTYIVILSFIIMVLRLYHDWRHRAYHLLFVAFAALLARGFLAELLYYLWDNPRPFEALNFTSLVAHEASPSFPSGHATVLFTLAFAVFFFKNHSWSKREHRIAGIVFLVGALVNGLARVFVGVHWPLDIAGGILFAFVSVLIAKRLMPFALGEK